MKYKVWDEYKNKFIDNITFFIGQSGELYYLSGKIIVSAPPELKTVFSTCETDKNGVELFNGDIGESRGEVNTFKFVIIFHENQFKIKYLGGYPLGGMLDTLYDQKSIFKIGNKFENPELLEN